jgi:hypothetical protein
MLKGKRLEIVYNQVHVDGDHDNDSDGEDISRTDLTFVGPYVYMSRAAPSTSSRPWTAFFCPRAP